MSPALGKKQNFLSFSHFVFLETKMKNGFKRCFGEDKRMESVERETENNKFCCFRLLKKQQKTKRK
jgi:hypothetical protein